jgi:transcriptional regulator with XRE-family HTH domain
MTDDAAPFGARLAAWRRSAGLSQEDLADRSGLSVRAISNLEHGRTRWPHPGSVSRLAGALGLTGQARAEFAAAAYRRLGSPAEADEAPEPGPAPADAGRVVPRQLPATAGDFVGREAELARLTSLLDERDGGSSAAVVISAIGGPAGVGKTALAMHWARQVASRFPDGQLYVNLRGFDPSGKPMTPTEAIRGLLAALGVPSRQVPASLAAQTGLYRSLQAGKRMLVVLDNARDSEQARPLLPGTPSCLALVTSRSEMTGLAVEGGARLITLDVLSRAEARQLLRLRLGATRLDAEPDAAAELIELCARLPLAVVIAAARASVRPGFPLEVLVRKLEQARQRLDVLEAGNDGLASVRTVFSWSVGSLSAAAARMFGLLGLHPGPDFPVLAAASLAGMPPAQAQRVLRELAGAHLLSEPAPGRFGFHDLLRAYAAEQAREPGAPGARGAAVARMLGYYASTGYAAARLVDPARETPGLPLPALPPGASADDLADQAQAVAWFETEHKTVVALIEQAAESGFDTHARLLSWIMADFVVGPAFAVAKDTRPGRGRPQPGLAPAGGDSTPRAHR